MKHILIFFILTTTPIFTANINGEAFFKDAPSGKIHICQGEEVILSTQHVFSQTYLSITAMQAEIDVQMLRSAMLNNQPKKIKAYKKIIVKNNTYIKGLINKIKSNSDTKVTKCGIKGNFSFSNITPGEYTIFSMLPYKSGGLKAKKIISIDININENNQNVILTE